mmetsp:Transcript_26672/g.63542  ORF Transcript_26672/g.63542 Transcript_26672/m.63542 type:complete len:302 (+) Transcript_26672:52-957(+)
MWQLEDPFGDIHIRPATVFEPEPARHADRPSSLDLRASSVPQRRQPPSAGKNGHFAWGEGPRDRPRKLPGPISVSSTPRSPRPLQGPESTRAPPRPKASLFSVLHDTLPSSTVSLATLVDRNRSSSAPCAAQRRAPRPAPDFRQTEDWRRANEVRQRRGRESVEQSQKKLERKPGLRVPSRSSSRQTPASEAKFPSSVGSTLEGDALDEASSSSSSQAETLNQPDEELNDATSECKPGLCPRFARPPGPATSGPSIPLSGRPFIGRPRVRDPDLLIEWPHEADANATCLADFSPWPHEVSQ